MNVVFMGTPDFAIPCLDMLINEGFDVKAVVTQPDRPKGRGKKMAPPPVKVRAMEKGITVLQPTKIKTREFEMQLREFEPSVIIVVAYGRILPQNILDIPSFGCINVHASLLPKYRGSAPINRAIINGEAFSGVTTMLLDAGMDTGDILLKDEVSIGIDMTAGELHDVLSKMGANLLSDTLQKLRKGQLTPEKQDEKLASYAPMMNKDTGKIQWNEKAINIHNLVRGTNPWPGAFTFYKKKRMKIWTTGLIETENMDIISHIKTKGIPGRIAKIDPSGLYVECMDGLIKILNTQMDNCKRMSIEECWHNMDEGEVLE